MCAGVMIFNMRCEYCNAKADDNGFTSYELAREDAKSLGWTEVVHPVSHKAGMLCEPCSDQLEKLRKEKAKAR